MSQSKSIVSRRRILQAGGLGALHLGVPGTVVARGKVDPGKGASGKSCIFVLLCGGPSHLDTWDLKPKAPDGIRGPYKPITIDKALGVPLDTRLGKDGVSRPITTGQPILDLFG